MPLGAVGIGALAGGALSAGSAMLSNKENANAASAYNAPLQAGLAKAEGVANQPFQAYTGQLAPGINAQESQAAGLAGQGAALQLQDLQKASTPFSGAALQQYEDPYKQQVINPTLQNLTQQYNTQAAQLQRKANMTDAFGYGRTAAELQPENLNYQQTYADTEAKGLGSAYNSALGEFNDQQGAFTKAAAGASDLGQGLLKTGETLNATTAAQDKANYGEFVRGQDWSRQQIQPYLQALGIAYKGGIQSPSYTNPLSAGIGGAISGAGLGLSAGGGGSSGLDASDLGIDTNPDVGQANLPSIDESFQGATMPGGGAYQAGSGGAGAFGAGGGR